MILVLLFYFILCFFGKFLDLYYAFSVLSSMQLVLLLGFAVVRTSTLLLNFLKVKFIHMNLCYRYRRIRKLLFRIFDIDMPDNKFSLLDMLLWILVTSFPYIMPWFPLSLLLTMLLLLLLFFYFFNIFVFSLSKWCNLLGLNMKLLLVLIF